MPKPNFAHAKRQRELAKKQKKEEKRQRKAAAESGTGADDLPATVPAGDDSTK
jgi:hypothetical protein